MADDGKKPDTTRPKRDDHVYGKAPGAGDWKRITRLAALVVLVVYVILFFLFNRNTVEVSLVVTTVSIPVVFVLILSFVLGMAVMYLLTYLQRRSGRKAGHK